MEKENKLNSFIKGSEEYYKALCFEAQKDFEVPEIFEKEIGTAVNNTDYVKLKSVFYHATRIKLLPLSSSGYDHCSVIWPLLDLLACDDFDHIYRVLPEGLPISANGFPMYINATNLLLCLLYNTVENEIYEQDKVVEKAEKFIATKKPLWERSVVACILALLKHDTTSFSVNLQKVCESYSKVSCAKYMKLQCQNAYGLIVLAKHFLTEEEFPKVEYPEYKNFAKGYIDWFLNQKELPNDLCFAYENSLEELNSILKKPVAVTRIHQPYLDSDNPYISSREKKAWYMDLKKMQNEFYSEWS